MMNNQEIQDALRAPTPQDRVNFRVGYDNKEKGFAVMLAYIDARYVQDKLDDVVGSENWEVEYIEVAGNMFCAITIRWPDGQVTRKMDVGIETDVEKEKGQASDAFKRSAVMYGIGRDLYGYPKHFADLDSRGKVPFDWRPPGWGESNDQTNVMSSDQTPHTTDSPQPNHQSKKSMKQAEDAQRPNEEETLQEKADRVAKKAAETAPDEPPEGYDERGLKTGTPPENENVIVKNLTKQQESAKAILFLQDFAGDVNDSQQTHEFWVPKQFVHNEVANMNGLLTVTMTRWIADSKGYNYDEISASTDVDEPATIDDDDLPF